MLAYGGPRGRRHLEAAGTQPAWLAVYPASLTMLPRSPDENESDQCKAQELVATGIIAAADSCARWVAAVHQSVDVRSPG